MAGDLFEPIKIKGVAEIQAALKEMDGESQKRLKVVFDDAAEMVAARARTKIPTRSGRARGSVRARSSQREARVMGGGARVAYYPWLDFGGRVGRRRSVTRPVIKGGRYIYPALAETRDEVYDTLVAALRDLATDAGLEVD